MALRQYFGVDGEVIVEEDLDDECADDDDENDEGECWEAGPLSIYR